MITRQDKLEEITESLQERHGDNIIKAFGTGSFFYKDMHHEYQEGKERVADIHLVVQDTEQFYENHELSEYELHNMEGSIDSKLWHYMLVNELIPLYHENIPKGYRLTVIPVEKLEDWTSFPNQSIGYFLVGRWQKPMEELITTETEEDSFVDERLKITRYIGVQMGLATCQGSITLDDFIKHIYWLSYLPENVRKKEAKIKPEQVFNAMKKESHEIYDNILLHFAKQEHLMIDKDDIQLLNILTPWHIIIYNLDVLRKTRPLYSGYFLPLIDSVFPGSSRYAARKKLRNTRYKDSKLLEEMLTALVSVVKKGYFAVNHVKLPKEHREDKKLFFKELRRTRE